MQVLLFLEICSEISFFKSDIMQEFDTSKFDVFISNVTFDVTFGVTLNVTIK